MTGLDSIHERVRISLRSCVDMIRGSASVDMERFEDLILATPARRNYCDIGTGDIRSSTMQYLTENAQWIGVCLFANSDFRACFKDAILIEKALLQVSRKEYADFREEMTLMSEKNPAGGDAVIGVNLSEYSSKADDTVRGMLSAGQGRFSAANMGEVYEELLQELSPEDRADTAYALYNLVYLVNAMNRNGVFRKYVRLVLDNVKRQLAE